MGWQKPDSEKIRNGAKKITDPILIISGKIRIDTDRKIAAMRKAAGIEPPKSEGSE